MAEIKPLAHWRRLDEVLLAADMLPLEEKAPSKPKSVFYSDGKLFRVLSCPDVPITISYRGVLWRSEQSGRLVLPVGRRVENMEFRSDGLFVTVVDEESVSPTRSPFPARALRDRPWDISALVEE